MLKRASITRRSFLRNTVLVSSLGIAPEFLVRAAEAQVAPDRDGPILVVVQLSGGNDGLNTVVPFTNDSYRDRRPTLALSGDRVLPLNGDAGFNSRLAPLKELYDEGKVGVVLGAGYPNPNRSHFRAMEIWHTASDSETYETTGWLGRYFDNCCSGSDAPLVGVALDDEHPQAFDGGRGLGIAFNSPDMFSWRPGNGADTESAFERLNQAGSPQNDTLGFLRHVHSNAVASSKRVRDAVRNAGIHGNPRGVQALDMVAAFIRAGLGTRIYYVSMGGFDTHADQLGRHDNLLGTFADSVARFQRTLERDGTADRVAILVFSEFGRRVAQNASGGTDHGAAAPLFLIGSGVKPGLHGAMPSLTDLDDGDLKHTVDFRSVYAALLRNWLNVNPDPILMRPFDPLDVIA